MLVEGRGMIARAFEAVSGLALPCVVFERSVGNSQTNDESQYARERLLLLDALAHARRSAEGLVYFSGMPIYGDFSVVVTETTPCRPITRYGRHQAECEELIRQSQAPYLIVRLPNVVGPSSNPHQLIPALVRQIRAGEVRVQQQATRDLIDVEDVVRLTVRLLQNGWKNETVIVASGRSIAVPEIVAIASRLLGAHPRSVPVTGGNVQRFDVSRLREMVGEVQFDEAYAANIMHRYLPLIASAMDRS